MKNHNGVEIPYGYCHCGCGQKTTIAKTNRRDRGIIKGKPNNYLHGHGRNTNKGLPVNYEGGEYTTSLGYVMVYSPNHPSAESDGCVRRATFVVEKILGKQLPKLAKIHHFNWIKNDDTPSNLVICQDRGYHNLLHRRQRAMAACGNPDWRKCCYCKKYGNPDEMIPRDKGNTYVHRECRRIDSLKYYHKTKKLNGGAKC